MGPSTAKIRRHVFIKGFVQGVNFRNATKQEADQLGIVGWVKNLEDGRVEAVFEGTPDAIQRMIEWCKRGPPAARVDELKVGPESAASVLIRFQVVR
jgi:acylphosphatase